jgi:SAM-dependent methyltransferase
MNWRVKGLVQKTLAQVPGGEQVHYLLQRRLGGLRDHRRELELKLEDWRLLMSYVDKVGASLRGAHLLEVGSGWYPTFPVCCFLAGAGRVISVDVSRLMRPELTWQAVEGLETHLRTIATAAALPLDEVTGRYWSLREALSRGADAQSATGGVFEYRAPADARATGLPDGSMDVVFSNSVLEHVPEPAVRDIFREARRILKDGGLMIHEVNCGDHYAYLDDSVSQLNYLQFSDREWDSLWNNKFQYQNRMRAHEFIERAEGAGFDILLRTGQPSEKRLAQLSALKVHPQFQRFTPEQLCITSCDFVARKRAGS